MSASPESKVESAREDQRKVSKRATLDKLRSKKRQEKEIPFVIDGDEVSFLFRSISAQEYDKLITNCPPNTEQRAAGSTYNINNFAPSLLAQVVVEPEISRDQWAEIWKSPDWNRGELMSLFGEAVELCNTGLKLGPTATV